MSNSLRVLIVDDSEDDTLLVVDELRRGGFLPEYEQVDSAAKLMLALTSKLWDLVITDHNMPGFDSTAALSIVKETGLDIPSIIVSGQILEDDAVNAMQNGAHDYVMKDNLKRLVPAVQRELQEAKSRGEHKKARATIRHMAHHDALTDLANRTEFERQTVSALMSASKKNTSHVLFQLDIYQFKVVNDVCGHVAGDEFLKQLAVILKQHLREDNLLARLGGDEFGVLLQNCPIEKGMRIANYISSTVNDFHFNWNDKTYSFGVSIGVVHLTDAYSDVDEVLTNADIACYAAKQQGRSKVKLYDKDDVDLVRHKDEMQWVSRINHALEEDLFQLYAQPIVPLHNLSGAKQQRKKYELLIRLKDKDGKILSASEFIPAAERYGLMPAIDRWVFSKLMSVYGDRLRNNKKNSIDTFFVNLSGDTFGDETFFTFIRDNLRLYDIPPETICFEVTETATIANLNTAVEFINQIRGEGCRFALDDFGTGMCSFSYLKTIPVDYLKIDGSFVKSIVYDQMDSSIVESINRIGHIAGLQTIAEYVENDRIKGKLTEMGVDFAQGYGIEAPKPMLEEA